MSEDNIVCLWCRQGGEVKGSFLVLWLMSRRVQYVTLSHSIFLGLSNSYSYWRFGHLVRENICTDQQQNARNVILRPLIRPRQLPRQKPYMTGLRLTRIVQTVTFVLSCRVVYVLMFVIFHLKDFNSYGHV
jgi:hypothetical protein